MESTSTAKTGGIGEFPLGDKRSWRVPAGWSPLSDSVFEHALTRCLDALEAPGTLARVAEYYDPMGDFAGSSFLDVGPSLDFEITAADLWAVSTLSMDVPPQHGRRLLGPSSLADHVRRGLRRLSPTLPLSDVDASTADAMWDLYDAIRTGLPPLRDAETTNQWVFASKLCARKRPQLFPVRDKVVFIYLSEAGGLGKGPGRLGQFGRDVPVMAYLITHPEVLTRLATLRHQLRADRPGLPLDWADLRLLDVVLWRHARSS